MSDGATVAKRITVLLARSNSSCGITGLISYTREETKVLDLSGRTRDALDMARACCEYPYATGLMEKAG